MDTLITDIIKLSAGLGSGIHPKVAGAISEFIIHINSYFTNAMEGNPSKLKDIEDALNNNLSPNKVLRNYQLEHLAHISTQKKMLERLAKEENLEICSKDFLCWLHREFYSTLPEEMHNARTHKNTKVPVLAGQLRDRPADDVGNHLPPDTLDEIENNLEIFQEAYSLKRLSGIKKFLAFASSHHRLLWIHPFRDGNGRVARLFTLAFENRLGIDSKGLWTVTRALARNRSEYDKHLMLADQPRRNDYDGRGPLSEENLILFCKYFLRECLDQLDFMGGMLELSNFEGRYKRHLKILEAEKIISRAAVSVLKEMLYKGNLSRGSVQDICGVKRRRATEIIKELLNSRLATSSSVHGDLQFNLTRDLAITLFPKLV
ncbi:MAG: Fic family protein [Deltaproteobacteria bacterium]|nr:Fic family protein [Deltaproteobacteria bacterium]